MSVYALHDPAERAGVLRWGASAVVVVMLHALLIALGVAWYVQSPPLGSPIPAILVDMAPASASPEPQPMEVAPGPTMQQADAPAEPPPEPATPAVVEQQIAPTPPQEKPEVVAPPEQKPEPEPLKPEPPKPEIAKEIPKPTLPPVKPKPAPVAPKKPSETPAPRTSAAPKAERQAPAAAAAVGASAAAAAAAALPSYRQLLAAHLQRYKQYPSGANGQQGTAMLSFVVGRGGQVLSSRLARSSGSAALDAETMAMIRRAQPLPAFPREITQASMSFTVPVQFSTRN